MLSKHCGTVLTGGQNSSTENWDNIQLALLMFEENCCEIGTLLAEDIREKTGNLVSLLLLPIQGL